MSKTLTAVGEFVAGGLAITAGVIFGQPILISLGVSAILAGVGTLLQPKQTSVGTANTLSFGQGPSPRRVIYGQFQTAGVLTYASFPPKENQATVQQNLHLVYTLAGHQICSFDAVAIDGTIYNIGTDIIWSVTESLWVLDPLFSPGVDDFYWQHMFFEFDCGNPFGFTGAPFLDLNAADATWSSDCKQLGCAKVHVKLRYDSGWTAVFPGGQIPNIQFLVTGKRFNDPRIETDWLPLHLYSQFQWFRDNNFVIWYKSNSGAQTSSIVGSRPNFEGNDGTPGNTISDGLITWTAAANAFTGTFGNVASYKVVGTTSSGFTNGRLEGDDWLAGQAWPQYSIIEAPIGYYQIALAAGQSGDAPNYPTFSKTLGATTSDNTITWTCLGRSPSAINPSNPALIVNDYLQDSDYGMATSASSIDVASVIAAANICEEQVLTIWASDGGKTYENLYSCNGMFDHSSARGNVLQALVDAMAGYAIPPGDFWHVMAGAYVAPTVSITDDDITGPIKGDFRLSKRDVANGVKGKFTPAFLPTNPAAAQSLTQIPGTWQEASYPPYQANGLGGKPNYLLEDGGQILWKDVNFEFCSSLWQAQRLAKIALMRLRFQQTLHLSCRLLALQLEAGDTFFFTHLRWQMNQAIFEVIQTSITFASSSSSSSKGSAAPTIGAELVARQTDPSIYEFTPPAFAGDTGEYSPYGITGVMTGVE